MENLFHGLKFYIKLGTIFIFTIYTGLFLLVRIQRAQIDDPVSKIENASIEKRKEYSEFAANMNSGLIIKSFDVFDVQKNRFVIDATLWFEFYVYQLGLDVIDKFTFVGGKILAKSAPNIRINEDKLLVTYQMVFEVRAELNQVSFPISNHRLVIVLVNYNVPPSEMMFNDQDRAHTFIVAGNVFRASDWAVQSLATQPGIIATSLDEYATDKVVEYPCLAFTVNVEKKSFKDLFVLFIPLFTAALFAWLSLMMNVNNHTGRFTLAVTAVTTILAYRYVIEQSIPRVGYFTLLDKFYLGFLINCFVIFLFHLVITSLWFTLDKKLAEEVAATGEKSSDEIMISGRGLTIMRDIFFAMITVYLFSMTTYFLLY